MEVFRINNFTLFLLTPSISDVVKAAEERALAAIHKARSEKSHAEEAIKSARKKYEENLKELELSRVALERQIQFEKETHQHALEDLHKKLAVQNV